MFHTLSWFFYFLLSLFLGIFLFISQGNSDHVLWKEIVFLFTVLALPFFDLVFQTLAKEKIFQSNIFDIEKYITHYIVIAGLLFSMWYGWLTLITMLFLGIFFIGITFQLNTKIPFIAALILFIYIPFFLILGENKLAEQLSIFAYYFLILGVVFQISETLVPKIAKLWK